MLIQPDPARELLLEEGSPFGHLSFLLNRNLKDTCLSGMFKGLSKIPKRGHYRLFLFPNILK